MQLATMLFCQKPQNGTHVIVIIIIIPPPPTHTQPPTQAHTYKTLVFIFCYKLKKVIYDLLKAMTKLSILTGFIELKVESLREIGNAAIWDLVGCVATSVY